VEKSAQLIAILKQKKNFTSLKTSNVSEAGSFEEDSTASKDLSYVGDL